MTKKLYKVTLRGMTSSLAGGVAHGVAFVVAEHPTMAYEALRRHLDFKDIGLWKDRELASIELMAESAEHPDCGYCLFPLPPPVEKELV